MSIINNYNNPVVHNWNLDELGEPTSILREAESKPVIGGKISLEEIPDPYRRVFIDGYMEIDLKKEIIDEFHYKVDYTNGIVFFHSSKEGQTITITRYYGRGMFYIPSSRVWTKIDDFGNVLTTFSDIEESLDGLSDQIENINTVAENATTIVADLKSNVAIGTVLSSDLQTSISTATSKKTQLDTSVGTANTSKTNLDTSISTANTARTNLNTSVSNATTSKTNLDASISSGNTLKNNLDTNISTGSSLNTSLNDHLLDGYELKTNLDALIPLSDEKRDLLTTSVSTASTKITEITGSINNATTSKSNLDASISSANTINNTLSNVTTGTIKKATDANTALTNSITTSGTSKSNLDTSIGTANTTKTNLDASVVTAGDSKTALDGSISTSTTKKSDLDGSISSATTKKTDLDASITSANTINNTLSNATTGTIKKATDINSSLNTSINTANTSKTNLDTSIGSSTTSKTNLDGSVAIANSTQSGLDTSISTASDKKTELETTITSANAINNTLANPTTGNIKKASDINSTLSGNITTANTSNSNLQATITSAGTSKSNLDTSISESVTAKTNLDGSVSTAITTKSGIDSSISSATTKKSDLDTSIGTSTTAKTNLDSSVSSANTINNTLTNATTGTIKKATDINSTLSTSVGTATSTKSNLDTSIGTANTTKSNLDDSIALANTSKTGLDGSILDGITLKTEIEDMVSGTTYEAILTDISNLQTNKSDITYVDNEALKKVDKVAGKQLSTEDYTSAEKTKLLGVATSATKNDTDANLKARTNHTGTQLASTISDFANTTRATVLTGLSVATNAVVSATDTILTSIGKLQKQITDNLATLTGHTGSYSNPHSVTKTQVGLGNVDNTSDAGKPVSTATQTALDGKVDSSRVLTDVPLNAKFTDTVYVHPTGTNPHGTTKADVGLSVVENKTSATIRGEITSSNVTTALGYTPLNSTLKGSNSGLAELDSTGKVPSAQLPSYVDDVVQYAGKANFPTTGETGKIYIDSVTNLTYRWSGTTYVEISASLALGETSSTAYRGDYGKVAYTHSQTAHNKAFVGLGNVDNTSDLSKPVSTATQTALDGKIDNSRVLTDVPLSAKFTDTVTTVNGKTGAITKADITALGIPAQDTVYVHPIGTNPHNTTKTDVGLGNVDNTSDLSKPVSTATSTALNGKVNNSRVLTDVPLGAKFTDTVYTHPSTHPYSMITGTPTSLPANGGNADTVGGFTVGVSVPANAKFTDTNTVYTHPTSDGSLHVPATGITNNDKVLKAGATAGSLAWGVDNDTITTINGKTGAITKADIVALGIPASDTNTNTTYSAGNGLALTGTSFSVGTPSTVTNATTNSITATSHTHALTLTKADITGLGIPSSDTNTTYTAGTGLTLTGTVFTPTFGTTAGTITQGNDSRLSNARTPVAHTHTKVNITDFAHSHLIGDLPAYPTSLPANGGTATTLSGLTSTVAELNFVDGVTSNIQTQLNGKASSSHTHAYAPTSHSHTKANITDFPTSMTPTAHTHGNVTNTGTIGTTANLMVQTTTNGVLTTKTAGTTAQYLRGDGAWGTPPNTIYTHPSTHPASMITIADVSGVFTATNVEGAMSELFQNVSSGKTLVATSITGKGVPTSGSDTFSTMATNISSINTDPSGDATAIASDLLSGKTAYTKGSKITGTIPSLGTTVYTPSTTNQTIASNRYLSGTQTILGDADLIPANIKQNVNIFGVVGNLVDGAGKKQFATGTFQGGSGSGVVTGLPFTPSLVVAYTYITANVSGTVQASRAWIATNPSDISSDNVVSSGIWASITGAGTAGYAANDYNTITGNSFSLWQASRLPTSAYVKWFAFE